MKYVEHGHHIDKRELATVVVAIAGAVAAIAKLVDKGIDLHIKSTEYKLNEYWDGSSKRLNFENQATFITNEFGLLAATLCENDENKSKRKALRFIDDSIR